MISINLYSINWLLIEQRDIIDDDDDDRLIAFTSSF